MEQLDQQELPLAQIEHRFRNLVPAKLYADAWVNPSSQNFIRVFNHMRTLHRILYGYLPRQVIRTLPKPGINHYAWEEGTLMFTDLAGFTPLLEGNAKHGKEGAGALLGVLNKYFSTMLMIVAKSGGNLFGLLMTAVVGKYFRIFL